VAAAEEILKVASDPVSGD